MHLVLRLLIHVINDQVLLRDQYIVHRMLSTDDFHFSNIVNRQFCALKPLQNPHWYFYSNKSIRFVIYLLKISSKIFEIIGKILTGQ